MNILILQASPRAKGNTAWMAENPVYRRPSVILLRYLFLGFKGQVCQNRGNKEYVTYLSL